MFKRFLDMKRIADITDDKVVTKVFDELKKSNVEFIIKPVADIQELWVNKDQIKTAKDVVKKCGLCFKLTWKF